ncbi:DNA-directed RNA polymerases I, II, and III subunit RPABC2 [Tetrabaena socialis]|uniref:DNA-directed RNA polymerases I, II, and III subunit RPABC2 n=1 Tax=Tetrabaena socialis TaxID=47790 RepID=A0A2J7ZJF9_9CHLO|nr:DNA-directed RNA polymerases I, II, and III subunit RPABC2 [Tetrabaena socialis]|eukprot:PNH00396.1 DNA-directed RNA polymerases I, II, and III subunit RPABC2 [Tetrabaena socialis]
MSAPNDVPMVTRPVLTRYERASIIGMRMEQLQHGALPFVDIAENTRTDVRKIALLELEQRKLPFIVVRKLPDGQKEQWALSELLG